ncbi:hypothetical protein [Methylobacterium radiotolerans]|uniref:Uncharacterized protein n=1 Tax=Methylobacterium radiotolerans (strain ATCC 27329 / DSM 1819 / JCM 2831 / NBRC 15690 / NCIMB 10815 / 0-1) TaxID=426355 RepID=B1M2M5_METRJ|nr:hypothetical protein [Methylobacterium radiotolerans]ACB27673.1 hypothetical protein Mrad2831_5728 [Methylobacterium radiotolerans JCM 2831]GEM95884.1 hypothetical protein MRA01_04240 [Methylobacterium radiotolerans]
MNEETVAVQAAETIAIRNAVVFMMAMLMKDTPPESRDPVFAKYREGVLVSLDYSGQDGPVMELIRKHLPDAADRMIADIRRVI